MYLRSFLASATCAALLPVCGVAGTITVTFDSGLSGTITLKDNLGVNLSPGLAADGDGAVLQLGYYTSGTATNNFLGTWVPLTGDGSLNTGDIALDNSGTINLNQTSVGDLNANGPGAGQFALSVQFDDADATRNQGLPGMVAGTTPLVLRFYNASTFAGATLYNAVSSDLLGWRWQTPSALPIPPITISLDDGSLEWESTAQGQSVANETKTTLVLIPEPSSLAVVLAGMVGLAATRRRRAA